MYKIVLVDDEKYVLDGLLRKVDWKSLNMEVAGTASDGLDALKLIREQDPHIVLTDINMDIMDGLRMLEELRAEDQLIEVVIISGYDDFTYAQKAVALRAAHYLLKPVSVPELEKVLASITKALDSRSSREETEKKNMLLVRKHLINQLLSGNCTADIIGTAKDAGMDFESWTTLVGCLDLNSGDSSGNDENSILLIEQILNENNQGFIIRRSRGELVFLLCFERGWQEEQIWKSAGWLGHRIIEQLSESFTGIRIGYGNPVNTAEDLQVSFLQASEALSFRLMLPGAEIIRYSKVDEMKARGLDIPEQTIIQLRDSLKGGDRKGFEMKLEKLFFSIKREPSIRRESLLNLAIQLVHNAFALTDEYVSKEYDCISRLESISDLNNLRQWIIDQTNDAFIYIEQQKKMVQYSVHVQHVLRTIEEKYPRDLSLKEIACELKLTPNHLTNLVKKETGETFRNLLLKKRVEKAKEYLAFPGNKIYDVAYFVGYDNEAYFSRLFKGEAGMSPREYRQKIFGDLKNV